MKTKQRLGQSFAQVVRKIKKSYLLTAIFVLEKLARASRKEKKIIMHIWQSGQVTRRRVFLYQFIQYAVIFSTFAGLAYTYSAGQKGELGTTIHVSTLIFFSHVNLCNYV